MSTKLTFTRGDSEDYKCAVTVDGVAADLTGAAIFFTVKKNFYALDADKVFQKVIGAGIAVAAPASGEFTLTIDPDDTKDLDPRAVYVWDVQIKQSDNSINTPLGLSGTLSITPDVYNATS